MKSTFKAQTRVLGVIQQSIRDEGRPSTRAEIAEAPDFDQLTRRNHIFVH